MSNVPQDVQTINTVEVLSGRAQRIAKQLRASTALREWLTDTKTDERVAKLGDLRTTLFQTSWRGSLDGGFVFRVRTLNGDRVRNEKVEFEASEVAERNSRARPADRPAAA